MYLSPIRILYKCDINMIIDKKTYDNCDQIIPRFIQKLEKIGILLERTEIMLLWIKALFENGITIIPIDASFPKERVNYIVEDANLDLLVTQEKYSEYNFKCKVFFVDCENKFEYITESDKAIKLPNEVAYILYTSGTTGRPKGVKVTRKALLNFMDYIPQIIDFSSNKRIASFASVSFDIFFVESVLAMEKGLEIVLADEYEQYNPKLMARLIQNKKVDMIITTPSRIQLLLNHDKELLCLKNIKELMIGGEQFPLNLLKILQEKTNAKIYNMYGPTETTICSTISDLTNKDSIDIGKPIKNTEVYIVDGKFVALSVGEIGEICISGDGLSDGYVGNATLTNEKFIILPPPINARVYRTGDLGRYLPSGDLEYIGRTDNQVKIRGNRIELEEIESHINRYEGIRRSVVVAREMINTEKVLEVYYMGENNIDYKDIIGYLSLHMPSYMIPAIFKRVEDFIYTKNGKIDRNRILECRVILEDKHTDRLRKISEVEKTIFDIIFENLDEKFPQNISSESDFKSIGLDSVTFITLVVMIEERFSIEFEEERFLITSFPTIKSLAEYVEYKVTQS